MAKKFIYQNPRNGPLPFIICGQGEAVNWRRREKMALKRLKKKGCSFPHPVEFYNNLRIQK